MKLEQLLDGVEVESVDGSVSIDVTHVTSDSRTVGEGSLFVAVPGLSVDGAKFASQAVERGASVIVSEGAVEVDAVRVIVKDARAALAVIAANFHGRPAGKLALVGVTGTSGKTTTTKMLESIFEATGEPVGLIGTIGYRAGSRQEIADRTTPDAVVLQEWFAEMVRENVRHAVMEVSSHALALKRTYGVPFAAAVFTNISRDHFDFHRDFEDYYAAKRILFDQIDTSRRTAVVNIDDAYGRRLANELGDAVVSFGMSEEADIHPAPGFESGIDGLRGDVVTPSGTVRLESPLVGAPNLYNWLGAIGAAQVVGIEASAIESGIAAVTTVRGRFERVASPKGTVIVDYAHKPDALEKLLNAVRDLAPSKRVVVVFGCGGDRDKGKRPQMGEIAGRLADLTIVTSDNPRNEEPSAILAEIEEGIRQSGSDRYRVVPDRREAIEAAVGELDDECVVVIAGKGHENYQIIGDRIVHFDDREEAEHALRKKFDKN